MYCTGLCLLKEPFVSNLMFLGIFVLTIVFVLPSTTVGWITCAYTIWAQSFGQSKVR